MIGVFHAILVVVEQYTEAFICFISGPSVRYSRGLRPLYCLLSKQRDPVCI